MSDLYIQKSDLRLSLSKNKLIVRNVDSEIIKEISLNKIDNIIIFGDSQLTTQLQKKLLQLSIPVHFFSKVGQYFGSLVNYRIDDFEKQKCQLLACMDAKFCLDMAKKIIISKILFQKELLKAYSSIGLFDDKDFGRFEIAAKGVQESENLSEILGYEGKTAKSYFYYLNLLVPYEFRFKGRNRRPSKDPVNALLNFGYSILYSFFIGYIKKVGLSPGYGFMHQNKRRHATLASDIMEPWRPIIVDDLVLKLLRNGDLLLTDFIINEKEECYLTYDGQRIFLNALRTRMLEIHRYVELEKKRFTFPYMVEIQLQSLMDCFNNKDSKLFKDIYREE